MKDLFEKYMNKITSVIFCALLLLPLTALRADDLADGFRNPPESMKPHCYWYWLNGDISKEGITKDLEAMAKVGIQRAMIGNIQEDPKRIGPVKMFSPEWYAVTHHALKEASRLGVEISMFNAPGWSQSGGPWIKPEQSMRRIAWNEIPAKGGKFSAKVRPDIQPLVQDVAVLAVPKKQSVTIHPSVLTLAAASWIWISGEAGERGVAPGTKYFRRVVQVDSSEIQTASMIALADDSYTLWLNGEEVQRGPAVRNVGDEFSIKEYLKQGNNVLAIAVKNVDGAAGLIAALRIGYADGKHQTVYTDNSWLWGASESDGWRDAVENPKGWGAVRVEGPVSMDPWKLPNGSLRFRHTAPFKARALSVTGNIDATLYALKDGQREVVAKVRSVGSNKDTDFLSDGPRVFSFKEVSVQEFELTPCTLTEDVVELTSEPMVAQVIEKQMGRMFPSPSPAWESYRFPDTPEPDDALILVKQDQIIDLTRKLAEDGTLACELPAGDWTIIYFGMVTTGKRNGPAPQEGTGLEVDKMSKAHIENHFNSMFGKLLSELTPEEKKAWKGVTIDSYEKGSQNWTDGFDKEFKKRTGYDPIKMLPVMTGRVIDSAKASDQFLWDLRRCVADMIAEDYVGGLTAVAHNHGLTTWCENYGHWGFPGDFTVYGRYSDEIGGEFWTNMPRHNPLGPLECRTASSTAHIYGRKRVYAEAFTSALDLGHHPYLIKRRGEEMFCQGINHFVLHVVAHQPRDGVPGNNPGFGTAFHRNTPWFNESRDWVRYLQRVHFMLQQGNPVADVAVYIGDFAPQMTGPGNPVPAGYDFDYLGSDAVLSNLDVVNGKWVVYDEKQRKKIAASYELLAMPESGYIRPHVFKRLDELKQAGGKVPTVGVGQALQESGVVPIVSEATGGLRWKARELDDGMLFFLSNFGGPGKFEAKLRVTDKVPELFNPVTGEVRKLARYKAEKDGTRICIHVNDPSDSFFVVFRESQKTASVVKVEAGGKEVEPGDLALFYDVNNRLTAESRSKGVYTLTMSDGTTKSMTIEKDSVTLPVAGEWTTTNKDEKGFSVFKETTFSVPADFGKGQKIELDLGKVEVMAQVTLNGKEFETLWMPPFVLVVTEALKTGENKLKVLVTTTSTGKPTLGDVKLKTIYGIAENY